jgi:hypothetical protein
MPILALIVFLVSTVLASAQFPDSESPPVTVTALSCKSGCSPEATARRSSSSPLFRKRNSVTTTENAFYFAANGSDANACTQAAPCLTVGKIASLLIPPGASINFRGGDNFVGCWALTTKNVPTGGDRLNPIVVQSFGAGKARLTANCGDGIGTTITSTFVDNGVAGVKLTNITFFGGNVATANVWVMGNVDMVVMDGIEAFGVTAIGPGHYSANIFIDGAGFGGAGCGAINNVWVINSKVHGQTVTSHDDNGITGSGCGTNVTNVHFNNNEIYWIGGHANANGGTSGNGIVLNGVHIGEAVANLVHDNGANANTCGGPAGIWAYSSDSVTIKNNEVHHIQPIGGVPPGACDWAAYDLDMNVTNSMVDTNYSHDNAGAAWLAYPGGTTWGPNTIRNNVSVNDSNQGTNGPGVAAISAASSPITFTNNTIWRSAVNNGATAAVACIELGGGTFPVDTSVTGNTCTMTDLYGRTLYIEGADVTAVEIKNNAYHNTNCYHIHWKLNNVEYFSLASVQATGKEAGSTVVCDSPPPPERPF